MSLVLIRQVELPHLIIFDLDGRTYSLKLEQSAVRVPFVLCEIGRGDLHINNIDLWLYTNSRGHCSYAILTQLAQAFVDGQQSAFQIEDLVACGQIVYGYVRDKLFLDGLASKYAETFDIECMTIAEISAELKEAITKPEKRSYGRAVRFQSVCEHNGWDALATGWSRLLSFLEPTELEKKKFPIVEERLKTGIERLVREHFVRRYVS